MKANDFWGIIFARAWNKETSDWGWRTYYYEGEKVTDFHLGVDRASGKSNDVYPHDLCYVSKLGEDSRSGKYVYLWDGEVFHFYAHLSKVDVQVGQIVKKSKVGVTGNTGHSTAVHLHYGIREAGYGDWINPTTWIANHTPRETEPMYVIANEGLNVRHRPSLSGKKLGAIVKGTKVNVYLRWKKWSYISYTIDHEKKVGWVSTKYLSKKR